MAGSHIHQIHPPLDGLDRRLGRLLGVDMRLMYGFSVPVLILVGLILVFALSPATWMVVVLVVIEISLITLIITKLVEMINEPEGREGRID